MLHLRRSLFITFFSTNSATLLQFGVTVILSRLLTPGEVGIFSITSVIIGIAAVFRDFGVSNYLQQEKSLTPEKIRSALGLIITTSWILAAFVYFASDYVAAYYGQPGVGQVMRVLTISFVLVPFASFFYAILSRDLRADKQAVVNVVSAIVYATTCITLAYQGFSYMALAWANVANISITILLYILMRPRGIQYIPSFHGWKKPLKFGSGSILGNLINQAHSSIPDLMLGKMSGPHNVGLYSRANGLVGLFNQIAGPTIHYSALPYIANNHHQNASLGPLLAKATSFLTGFAWPAFIFTALFPQEIIKILYGESWLDAAPLVTILCIAGAGRISYSLCAPALTAIGRPSLSAISFGVATIARIGLIFLFGANDIWTFAMALCIADIITLPVPAILMSRYLGYSMRMSLSSHIGSLKVAATCLLTLGILKATMPAEWADISKLILAVISLMITWFLSIIYFRHPIKNEFPLLIQRVFPNKLAGHLNNLLNRENTDASQTS